jgi:D-alanyl-D-alanine dipeptidase
MQLNQTAAEQLKKLTLIFFMTLAPTAALTQPTHQLVEVQRINPNILVELRYATTNNFTGNVIYKTARCFLQRPVAERLSRVQKKLEAQGYRLKIWDGYRPMSAQQILYDATPDDKKGYVADPKLISKHSRGAAVDLTLVDSAGGYIEMPTDFDAFVPAAAITYSKLSKAALKHRTILHDAMTSEGFLTVKGEWWHFNAPDWKDYEPLNIQFDELP